MTFREVPTFEEVLVIFKEAEEAKANKLTKKERSKSTHQNNKHRSPPKKTHNCEEIQNKRE